MVTKHAEREPLPILRPQSTHLDFILQPLLQFLIPGNNHYEDLGQSTNRRPADGLKFHL